MKTVLSTIVISFALGACSSLESSTYENRSTKDETVVTATGKAAEVAAGANTSHNCPSCGPDSPSGSASTQDPPKTKVEESADKIATSAGDTLTNEISQEVNKTIRKIFD